LRTKYSKKKTSAPNISAEENQAQYRLSDSVYVSFKTFLFPFTTFLSFTFSTPVFSMSVYNNPSAQTHPDGVSPIIAPVSPQSTGLAASNPSIISPQITGVTTNAAPAYTSTAPALDHPQVHQQQPHPQTETHAYPETNPEAQAYQGIEVVSPSYNMDPNANPNGNPNQNQNQNPNPNPNGYYDESKSTHPPPQYAQGAVPQQQQGRNQYATALPLRALQSGPTPVDCPVCGVREVTAVEYVSGSTTQYVDLFSDMFRF
jgi:hypothetical protein